MSESPKHSATKPRLRLAAPRPAAPAAVASPRPAASLRPGPASPGPASPRPAAPAAAARPAASPRPGPASPGPASPRPAARPAAPAATPQPAASPRLAAITPLAVPPAAVPSAPATSPRPPTAPLAVASRPAASQRPPTAPLAVKSLLPLPPVTAASRLQQLEQQQQASEIQVLQPHISNSALNGRQDTKLYREHDITQQLYGINLKNKVSQIMTPLNYYNNNYYLVRTINYDVGYINKNKLKDIPNNPDMYMLKEDAYLSKTTDLKEDGVLVYKKSYVSTYFLNIVEYNNKKYILVQAKYNNAIYGYIDITTYINDYYSKQEEQFKLEEPHQQPEKRLYKIEEHGSVKIKKQPTLDKTAINTILSYFNTNNKEELLLTLLIINDHTDQVKRQKKYKGSYVLVIDVNYVVGYININNLSSTDYTQKMQLYKLNKDVHLSKTESYNDDGPLLNKGDYVKVLTEYSTFSFRYKNFTYSLEHYNDPCIWGFKEEPFDSTSVESKSQPLKRETTQEPKLNIKSSNGQNIQVSAKKTQSTAIQYSSYPTDLRMQERYDQQIARNKGAHDANYDDS